jgi:hypothetical protein
MQDHQLCWLHALDLQDQQIGWVMCCSLLLYKICKGTLKSLGTRGLGTCNWLILSNDCKCNELVFSMNMRKWCSFFNCVWICYDVSNEGSACCISISFVCLIKQETKTLFDDPVTAPRNKLTIQSSLLLANEWKNFCWLKLWNFQSSLLANEWKNWIENEESHTNDNEYLIWLKNSVIQIISSNSKLKC